MKGQICHGCGRPRAGGGQRFCWECLGLILSIRPAEPAPAPPSLLYPVRRKARPRKRKLVPPDDAPETA
jgi:hypothetical protein